MIRAAVRTVEISVSLLLEINKMKKFVFIKDGVARIMTAQDYVTDPMVEIRKWHSDDQAKVTSVREISANDIPTNTTIAMRDAWEDNGSEITVNLTKARAGKTKEMREERNKRLTALDVSFMRAVEAGDTGQQSSIATLKQKLRDLPATIQSDLNGLDTPDKLEKFQPDWPS